MPSETLARTETAPVAAEPPDQGSTGANDVVLDEVGRRSSAPWLALVPSRATVHAATQRLSQLIATATVLACALIALGIVLYVLDANTKKWLVSDIEQAARWLASPFENTFMVHSAKLAVALNWGIAIGLYAIAGRVAARVVRRLPERIARRA